MEVPCEWPRVNGDIDAELKADLAYQQGRWLEWVAGDEARTSEERILLGGRFDDRALADLGLDGTVLAQGILLFDEEADALFNYFKLSAQLLGTYEPNSSDELYSQLCQLHEFYTSPVVREPERRLSNYPIEVPGIDENVIWEFDGEGFIRGGFDLERAPESVISGEFAPAIKILQTSLPEGMRLVIDNIPFGDKHDNFPYSDENPVDIIQIHVYRNGYGYLVADKVDTNGVLQKDRSVSFKPTGDPHVLEVDEDAPHPQTIEDIVPREGQKKEFTDPYTGERNIVLINTRTEWVFAPQSYDWTDISVSTPDDTGSALEVEMRISTKFPEMPGPIKLRLVDDPNPEIAHEIFQ